jgi:hypothetical protein
MAVDPHPGYRIMFTPNNTGIVVVVTRMNQALDVISDATVK